MSTKFDIQDNGFDKIRTIESESYKCGYCGKNVSSEKGVAISQHSDGSGSQVGGIYICPNCKGPTFLPPGNYKFPGAEYGQSVNNVPDKLKKLYDEARSSVKHSNYTASVLIARKILMNIAVDLGADDDKSFLQYVNYLSDEGYIPPNGKHWVDHIRKKGNEANHEIHLMEEEDAKELVTFLEMLLKFVYELPNEIPKPEEKDDEQN